MRNFAIDDYNLLGVRRVLTYPAYNFVNRVLRNEADERSIPLRLYEFKLGVDFSTAVLVTASELLVSCTMIIQLRFIDYSK